VFVHISAVESAGMRGLAEGQKLSFELTNERGKTSATKLAAA
jgi:cold shock protein